MPPASSADDATFRGRCRQMRLWSIHPKYLDAKGLVALWRDALLAQKVLRGATKGYTRHPQLERFRNAHVPEAAIATYLCAILREAEARGYEFDGSKIPSARTRTRLRVTTGQAHYELEHLRAKLRARDRRCFQKLGAIGEPELNPLF